MILSSLFYSFVSNSTGTIKIQVTTIFLITYNSLLHGSCCFSSPFQSILYSFFSSEWTSLTLCLASFFCLLLGTMFSLHHSTPLLLSAMWLGGFHLPSHCNMEFISDHFLSLYESFQWLPTEVTSLLLFARRWTAVSITTQPCIISPSCMPFFPSCSHILVILNSFRFFKTLLTFFPSDLLHNCSFFSLAYSPSLLPVQWAPLVNYFPGPC